MRGRLTNQDLTDYALNALAPHERLYVESMLAVSEECRKDVYDLLEVSQMLEEGFERELNKVPLELTNTQRIELLTPKRRFWFVVRDAAAIAAGFIALVGGSIAALKSDLLHAGGTQHFAEVSKAATEKAATMLVSAIQDNAASLALSSEDPLRELREDLQERFDSLPDDLNLDTPAVCTPPAWIEGAEMVRLEGPEMPTQMIFSFGSDR